MRQERRDSSFLRCLVFVGDLDVGASGRMGVVVWFVMLLLW